MASIISASDAPALLAPSVWPLMQYGHWVTCATATAISCLVFTSSAPSAKTALLKALKAASCSGANSARFLLFLDSLWETLVYPLFSPVINLTKSCNQS